MEEFHYRLRSRTGGYRAGAHAGSTLGAGQEFATHARLFDHPDPRRLDLRASVRDVRHQWLVRNHKQRVAVPVYAVVDVSASMQFGGGRAKLQVAADFVEALGHSAFRVGDAVGLLAFDRELRDDLFLPARHGRGMAGLMSGLLRDCRASDTGTSVDAALNHAVGRLAGKRALVFLVSDFHWPLAVLGEVLDTLSGARVVPLVVWNRAETEPPPSGALLTVRDAESGSQRTLWMRDALREQWRTAVANRRAEIDTRFRAREIQPFWVHGAFESEALSRYFLENVA
ncbi:VWA domain-containing protein [Ideonella azotifigens]|uniref:DUF58 domain-containing protein n=1 Tax=Ideonella azotifigens TaxID=513160 RepID=A0ABP3VUD4_9BURK|nr:VWA domain-containing protein [Ideonella azotifigens]MCD2340461.1 VWA domain-containing protein [Ideonella azotifigens]